MKKPTVRKAFREAADFAHQITQAFGKVVVVALRHQCERQGVDGRALDRDLKDA